MNTEECVPSDEDTDQSGLNCEGGTRDTTGVPDDEPSEREHESMKGEDTQDHGAKNARNEPKEGRATTMFPRPVTLLPTANEISQRLPPVVDSLAAHNEAHAAQEIGAAFPGSRSSTGGRFMGWKGGMSGEDLGRGAEGYRYGFHPEMAYPGSHPTGPYGMWNGYNGAMMQVT